MKVDIEKSWLKVLKNEFEKGYFNILSKDIDESYTKDIAIYPSHNLIFNAFNLCSFDKVRIVIIGQDPYHGEGQAHGLAFSVQGGVKTPPSLKNIYKEIKNDIGTPSTTDGTLDSWATQGVLLLNTTLTVEAGKPGSHQKLGWEEFTNAVITEISDKKEHVVFMLWGKHAQSKESLINTSKHLILKAPHPSPLSVYRGFFGCKHFSKTNEYLKQNGLKEIEW